MSDEKEDGGPGPFVQFPDVTPMNGVTLRDWLAGQALTSGICTGSVMRESELTKWFGRHATSITHWQVAAAQAYELADAMLAHRKRSRS